MELWKLEKKKEENVWDKKPFGNFPNQYKSLRDAIMEHLETRDISQYPKTYWVVFSAKEEEMAALAISLMPDQILAPYSAAETFLKHLLNLVDRMRSDAPIAAYISESPDEFTTPPFRLALMFRTKQ